MEILQNLWIALTSENEMLAKLILVPTTFIEALVTMLLFSTILNIQSTKVQKAKYVTSIAILGILSLNLIPQPYNTFLNMIAVPLFIIIFFQTTIIKGIISEIIIFIVTAILESIIATIANNLFSITSIMITVIPLYRFVVALILYFLIFALYLLIKYTKFNINILDDLSTKTKILFFVNFAIAIIIIGIQFYLLYFYSTLLPTAILVFSILMLVSYLCISIYSISETAKLQSTRQTLEEAQLYNKTLSILHDNIRTFKHDFNNIVQSIGGYIATEDILGLKKYYSELLNDCQISNTLNVLNPSVINDPAIYSLITSKYHKATSLGIKVNLEIFLDLTTLNMKIYEFTRIFGILLDNAIEATSECEQKEITIIIQKDQSRPRQLAIVKNTYKNKQVDTEKIYEKGYSTKPHNTGLGLWKVRQILKSNNNLNLYTSKTNEFFSQQLEIYL